MPTTPYATLLTSVNSDSPVAGARNGVASGATVQLTGQSTVGWQQQRFEIYRYPAGYGTPAGWSKDTDGSITGRPGTLYYNAGFVPPTFTLSLWGKYLFQLKVNGATLADPTPKLTDDTAGISVYSPINNFRDFASWEDNRFNVGQWPEDQALNLRTLEAGGGGSSDVAHIVSDTNVDLSGLTTGSHLVMIKSLTADRTVTMPTAPTATMKVRLLGDSTLSSHNITANGNGKTIVGNANFEMGPAATFTQYGAAYSGADLEYNGTEWSVVFPSNTAGANLTASLLNVVKNANANVDLSASTKIFNEAIITGLTANRTVTLPSVPFAGMQVSIKGDNTLASFKISTTGGNVDGAGSISLGLTGTALFAAAYAGVILQYNGAEWSAYYAAGAQSAGGLNAALMASTTIADANIDLSANTTMFNRAHTTGMTAGRTTKLPSAPFAGMEVEVSGDNSTSTQGLTVDGNGKNINGAATFVIGAGATNATFSGAYAALTVQYTGAEWRIA